MSLGGAHPAIGRAAARDSRARSTSASTRAARLARVAVRARSAGPGPGVVSRCTRRQPEPALQRALGQPDALHPLVRDHVGLPAEPAACG